MHNPSNPTQADLELPPLSSYTDDGSACLQSYPVFEQSISADCDDEQRIKLARKKKRAQIEEQIKSKAQEVSQNNKAVGFKAVEASLVGFRSKRLPEHIQTLLTQAKLLPYRDEFFIQDDGLCRGCSQERTSIMMGYMLSVLVVHTNITNGFVVVATSQGGNTPTHDDLRMEVAIRHGEYIPESTWHYNFKRLVDCGYIKSYAITVYEEGHLASFHAEASHKEMTPKLMDMLGFGRLSVRNGAARHAVKLNQLGKSFKRKPRYAQSRYRQNGDLRKNANIIEPTQELLDLLASHHIREAAIYPHPPS